MFGEFRRITLRWYWYVVWKDNVDWVKGCTELLVSDSSHRKAQVSVSTDLSLMYSFVQYNCFASHTFSVNSYTYNTSQSRCVLWPEINHNYMRNSSRYNWQCLCFFNFHPFLLLKFVSAHHPTSDISISSQQVLPINCAIWRPATRRQVR